MVEQSDKSLEFDLDPKSMSIGMTTYYPEYKGLIDTDSPTSEQINDTQTVRANLSFKTVRTAAQQGYNVFVSDGGSDSKYLHELANIPGVTVLRRSAPERAIGRRQGFEAAEQTSGVKAAILMEPEKHTLVPFIPQIVKPILTNAADIVIIGRQDETFKRTWPAYMYEVEKAANKKWNDILRTFGLLKDSEDLHMWAGPRATSTRPEIMRLWKEIYSFEEGPNKSEEYPTGWASIRRYAKPEQYSDGQYFPVIKALYQRLLDPQHGPRVINIDLPFEYPAIQRMNEMTAEKERDFREKRKDQFYGFMVETVQYIRFLMGPNAEKSKLHLVKT